MTLTLLTHFQVTMKPSPSYPGYFVTREGVITNRRGHVLRQFADTYGSLKVTVDTPAYKGSATVARMVGEVFCRSFDKSLRALHRDGDKTNCRASNLKWVPVSKVARAPFSKNPRPCHV